MNKRVKRYEKDPAYYMNPLYVALNNKREAQIARAAILNMDEGSFIVRKFMCFILYFWMKKWDKYIPQDWKEKTEGLNR
jgi:hypothetical protein